MKKFYLFLLVFLFVSFLSAFAEGSQEKRLPVEGHPKMYKIVDEGVLFNIR
ncbi:MAG: hypothetical protein LBQ93_02320 [Treponema sp.]|jgi:hypothetical protein|nr:hypothetical protein [Treponema sp.]